MITMILYNSLQPMLQSLIQKTIAFPHLWRFLGSASDRYSDVVLAIMDQFNWTRIGIVYNTGSLFHSEIAKHLQNKNKIFDENRLTFVFWYKWLKRVLSRSCSIRYKKQRDNYYCVDASYVQVRQQPF